MFCVLTRAFFVTSVKSHFWGSLWRAFFAHDLMSAADLLAGALAGGGVVTSTWLAREAGVSAAAAKACVCGYFCRCRGGIMLSFSSRASTPPIASQSSASVRRIITQPRCTWTIGMVAVDRPECGTGWWPWRAIAATMPHDTSCFAGRS